MRYDEWSIKGYCDKINEKLVADLNYVIVVTGRAGWGKTTLAWHIANSLNEDFFEKMKERTIFTRKALLEAIMKAERGSRKVYVIDEAIGMLFRRDFAYREQKEIIKILNEFRYKNMILIFCTPRFWQLDTQFRDLVNCWLHIIKRGDTQKDTRGLASILVPFEGQHLEDPWIRKENIKECEELIDIDPVNTKAKNYTGYIPFGDMPDYAKKVYHELEEQNKLITIFDNNKQEDKSDIRLKKYLIHADIFLEKLGLKLKKQRAWVFGFNNQKTLYDLYEYNKQIVEEVKKEIEEEEAQGERADLPKINE